MIIYEDGCAHNHSMDIRSANGRLGMCLCVLTESDDQTGRVWKKEMQEGG